MVRTRFAPSPTGYLHVGGLRTALYSYLYARQNHGQFLLRIEDTDQKRLVEGALESLIDTLTTMGLSYDEGPVVGGDRGPYIQSERTEIYREHAQKLLEQKAAYPCFCTPERLVQMREKQTALKKAPMYDRTCLNLSEAEIEEKKKAGTPFVIRQKIAHGRKLKFKDLVRGTVIFDTSTVDDQVLMKSDNFPTYHLANVVDDHFMEITHVIRGEEWLPSTPKHLLLYEAFGWTPPEYAHLSLLLNKDKSKLSKRQGDVSVESYLEKGYIKEALLNFVALLGWHPGKGIEKEIFSMEELIETFSLDKVHKAGAVFDVEKLNWFNFQWQKKIHTEKLAHIAKEIDSKVDIQTNDRGHVTYTFTSISSASSFEEKRAELLLEMCGTHISRDWIGRPFIGRALITVEEKILKSPAEVEQQISFYFSVKDFNAELCLNEKMKVDLPTAKIALEESLKLLESLDDSVFDDMQKLQNEMVALAQKLNIKNGQLLWPLRVALTGEQFSPGVFELLWVMGKKESVARIQASLKKI